MSSKIGRPKVENPQEKKITVRVNDEMLKRLENWCEINNKSLSEALRLGIEKLLEK